MTRFDGPPLLSIQDSPNNLEVPMSRYEEVIDPTSLRAGDEVTVWNLNERGCRTCGQGGKVVVYADVTHELIIESVNGTRHHSILGGEDLVVDIEVPLDANECIEYGTDCKGEVDYYTVGNAMRAFPRCSHHIDLRLQSYETSMERYADSDVEPEWFDESYAGESWD